MELEAKNRFLKTVEISKQIERGLESFARVIEGTMENGDHLKWDSLVSDLSVLFPNENCERLATSLVTDACRTAYLKLKQEQSVTSYLQGR